MERVNIKIIIQKYHIRKPTERDTREIWHLIKKVGSLDLNSAYCYMMLCKNFSSTCAVALNDQEEMVGFVSGYLIPDDQETLFIWQVAVDEGVRGRGVAGSLIQEILSRSNCSNVRFIKTTVSPSNHASQAIFKKLAQKLGTGISTQQGFDAQLFPTAHEDEPLLKIGPFNK